MTDVRLSACRACQTLAQSSQGCVELRPGCGWLAMVLTTRRLSPAGVRMFVLAAASTGKSHNCSNFNDQGHLLSSPGRYEREMTRLGAQLRVKKEAVRSAERDLEAQRRGYMVDPMVMASHVDVPSTQKEIQRIEVKRPLRTSDLLCAAVAELCCGTWARTASAVWQR